MESSRPTRCPRFSGCGRWPGVCSCDLTDPLVERIQNCPSVQFTPSCGDLASAPASYHRTWIVSGAGRRDQSGCRVYAATGPHDRRRERREAIMSLEIIPSGAALGAEIRGVDLAQPLDDATFAAIERAYA